MHATPSSAPEITVDMPVFDLPVIRIRSSRAGAAEAERSHPVKCLDLPTASHAPLSQPILFRGPVLARNLAHGALLELRLTPKPGLVDLRDYGSHPDLSYTSMARSASMLPAFYRELFEAHRRGGGLIAYRAAGRRAEERMLRAAGSNTHGGYLFLSGLLVIAALDPHEAAEEETTPFSRPRGRADATGRPYFQREIGFLRLRVVALAEDYFQTTRSLETNGARVREAHGIGGIRSEALSGLPSVFEIGWPAFSAFLAATGDFTRSSYYMMSRLMQCVEDTTTVHRCGLEGLQRIRQDGVLLQRCLEENGNHRSLLERWNNEYAEKGLTLGGVADCMGLTYAVHLTVAGTRESDIGGLEALLLRDRHGV